MKTQEIMDEIRKVWISYDKWCLNKENPKLARECISTAHDAVQSCLFDSPVTDEVEYTDTVVFMCKTLDHAYDVIDAIGDVDRKKHDLDEFAKKIASDSLLRKDVFSLTEIVRLSIKHYVGGSIYLGELFRGIFRLLHWRLAKHEDEKCAGNAIEDSLYDDHCNQYLFQACDELAGKLPEVQKLMNTQMFARVAA